MRERFVPVNCAHHKGDKFCEMCGALLKKDYLTPEYDTKTGEKILVYQLVCTRANFVERLFGNTCETKFQY